MYLKILMPLLLEGRMQESSLFMSSSGQRYSGVSSYSSLTDKHLQEYFLKKFMNPRPPSGVSTLYPVPLKDESSNYVRIC